jgi:hypothetical protein
LGCGEGVTLSGYAVERVPNPSTPLGAAEQGRCGKLNFKADELKMIQQGLQYEY